MSICEFKGSLKRAEFDRLPGWQTGRGVVASHKGGKFPRWSSSSSTSRLETTVYQLLSLSSRLPADGLAQQVQGLGQDLLTTVADQSTTRPAFKLTNPKVGKGPSEAANPWTSRRGWTFCSPSPDSAGQRVFPLCVSRVCFFSPKEAPAFNC